jgi:hypothetical protein
MPILHCYVDNVTMEILRRSSERDPGSRSVEQLAEAAIADVASRALGPGETADVRALWRDKR